MISPEHTPHATVLRLLTGHFHVSSGYRAYRENGVQDWLLVYTASGMGRFGYPGGEISVAAGDWVLLRPNTLHDYAVHPCSEHWELVWAHFIPRFEWLALLGWPQVHDGLARLTIVAEEGTPIAERFRQVHRLRSHLLDNSELAAVNALEDVLLRCQRHNPVVPRANGDPRVQCAMDFLERNMALKLSLDDVAAAVGLSTSRFSHLFRINAGQTPQRYLEALRMQRAAALLDRTGFSVKQIAAAVGFDNALYFSVRFKAFTLYSPTAYRAQSDKRSTFRFD